MVWIIPVLVFVAVAMLLAIKEGLIGNLSAKGRKGKISPLFQTIIFFATIAIYAFSFIYHEEFSKYIMNTDKIFHKFLIYEKPVYSKWQSVIQLVAGVLIASIFFNRDIDGISNSYIKKCSTYISISKKLLQRTISLSAKIPPTDNREMKERLELVISDNNNLSRKLNNRLISSASYDIDALFAAIFITGILVHSTISPNSNLNIINAALLITLVFLCLLPSIKIIYYKHIIKSMSQYSELTIRELNDQISKFSTSPEISKMSVNNDDIVEAEKESYTYSRGFGFGAIALLWSLVITASTIDSDNFSKCKSFIGYDLFAGKYTDDCQLFAISISLILSALSMPFWFYYTLINELRAKYFGDRAKMGHLKRICDGDIYKTIRVSSVLTTGFSVFLFILHIDYFISAIFFLTSILTIWIMGKTSDSVKKMVSQSPSDQGLDNAP